MRVFTFYHVTDSPWNRANYPDIIGKVYDNPPSYAGVEVLRVSGSSTPKHRIWGGWYQHDVYTVDGREIGRIQTKRQNGRVTVSTSVGGYGVLGPDLHWLIKQYITSRG